MSFREDVERAMKDRNVKAFYKFEGTSSQDQFGSHFVTYSLRRTYLPGYHLTPQDLGNLALKFANAIVDGVKQHNEGYFGYGIWRNVPQLSYDPETGFVVMTCRLTKYSNDPTTDILYAHNIILWNQQHNAINAQQQAFLEGVNALNGGLGAQVAAPHFAFQGKKKTPRPESMIGPSFEISA